MAAHEILLSLIPVFGLAIIVVVQIALAFVQPARLPWWSLAWATIVGIGFSTIATTWVAPSNVADLVANEVVNIGATTAFAFGYFNFVNLGYTSLRIRMLRRLRTTAHGPGLGGLRSRYDSDELLDLRLARLVRVGELAFDGERYHLASRRRVLLLANVLHAVRRLLRIER